MRDTYSDRMAQHNLSVEVPDPFESASDHSSQRARYDIFKMDKALEVVPLVKDRHKNALDCRTYLLANVLSMYDDRVPWSVVKWANHL